MALAKLNYTIYNKEILAIIRLFGHFKAELIRACWAELLSEYDFTITYRPAPTKTNPWIMEGDLLLF
ncbi:unnamed protein product [Diplocarpon coronariae]